MISSLRSTSAMMLPADQAPQPPQQAIFGIPAAQQRRPQVPSSVLSDTLAIAGDRVRLLGSQLTPASRLADRPGGTAAGTAGVAGVPAGTPVQRAITVVLNCNAPICSFRRCALIPHQVVTDSMPKHSANNYICGVVRALHIGANMGSKAHPS
jgi:hypothetical protein